MRRTTSRGRVELAALLAGVVGELVDEVLIGVAQHVAGVHLAVAEVGVAEVQPGEVVQKLADEALAVGRAAQLLLVVPVDAGEHAVQPPGVGVLDGEAGDVQRLAQAHGLGGDEGPAGVLRHEELVLVAVGERRFPRHAPVVDRALHLLVETVGEALEEEDGEDVVLVVGRVYLPPQDVGGLPQLALEFLAGQRHGVSSGGLYCLESVPHYRVPEGLPAQLSGTHLRRIGRLRCFHELGHERKPSWGGHGDLNFRQACGGQRERCCVHRNPLGQLSLAVSQMSRSTAASVPCLTWAGWDVRPAGICRVLSRKNRAAPEPPVFSRSGQ